MLKSKENNNVITYIDAINGRKEAKSFDTLFDSPLYLIEKKVIATANITYTTKKEHNFLVCIHNLTLI